MKENIFILVLCLVVCGCSTQNANSADLTESELDVLKNYFDSPETVEQAARICLSHKLSRTEVLKNTSDIMRREVTNDSIIFLFAPSQWWAMTFDQDGKANSAEITGKKITQEPSTKR